MRWLLIVVLLVGSCGRDGDGDPPAQEEGEVGLHRKLARLNRESYALLRQPNRETEKAEVERQLVHLSAQILGEKTTDPEEMTPPEWRRFLNRLSALRQEVEKRYDPELRAIIANEQATFSNIQNVVGAQLELRHSLRKGGSPLPAAYWVADVSGLYRLTRRWEQGELFPEKMARSDSAPLHETHALGPALCAEPEPDNGYLLRMIPSDQNGKSYGRKPEEGGRPAWNKRAWAMCAYPAVYGETGYATFIINQAGKTHQGDTRGRPVERWPTHPEDGDWSYVPDPAK